MKKRFGDRKDGTRLTKIHSMHYIMPLMYPHRCDNEAVITECIDLTKINAYLEKKNADKPAYEYNLFQVMVTAVLKTITLRPKMNRFIANKTMYQRNEVTAAFTVKKIFDDDGGEALASIHSKETDNIDTIHQTIYDQIAFCRSDEKDPSTASMDAIQKIPGFLVRAVGAGARFLDRHGWMPQSVIATDPFYSSVVLANLGSIGLHAGYHHLTNWGTCSVFCVVGKRQHRPLYDQTGEVKILDSVDISLTIDERIADGYYYAKTIRLLKHLLQNPELLELPLGQEVEY